MGLLAGGTPFARTEARTPANASPSTTGSYLTVWHRRSTAAADSRQAAAALRSAEQPVSAADNFEQKQKRRRGSELAIKWS